MALLTSSVIITSCHLCREEKLSMNKWHNFPGKLCPPGEGKRLGETASWPLLPTLLEQLRREVNVHCGALCVLEQSTAGQELCILYPTFPGPGLPQGKILLLLLLFGTEQHCFKSHLPQEQG